MSRQIIGVGSAGPGRGRSTGLGLNAAILANTATPVQFIEDCCEVDIVSLQLVWTGNLTATVVLSASNDYIPNVTTPQTESTTLRPTGPTWEDITAQFTRIGSVPAGSANHCSWLYPRFFEYLFLKITLTPTSDAGAKTAQTFMSGKSVG